MTEEKIKVWIGIDPGKSGGIVLIDERNLISKWVMPKIGDDIDIHQLHKTLSSFQDYNVTIILEEVHSIYGTSAGSNFTFGFVCGAIEAIVISQHYKLIKVQPKIWQKEIWQTSEVEYKAPKKAKPGAEDKKPSNRKVVDTKLTSLKACKRLFPYVDLRGSERSKVPHDGITDALLIAEYGRRKNL